MVKSGLIFSGISPHCAEKSCYPYQKLKVPAFQVYVSPPIPRFHCYGYNNLCPNAFQLYSAVILNVAQPSNNR